MDRQQSKPLRDVEGSDTEYQYVVHVRASETFANVMRRLGISVPEDTVHVSFTSPRRLNMKGYKEGGLIWSYSIIRVRWSEEVVEEG